MNDYKKIVSIMNAEAKKITVAKIILSIENERVLEEMYKNIIALAANTASKIVELENNKNIDLDLENYRTEIKPTFSLEEEMKKQNYTYPNKNIVFSLIDKAAIEEPLEDLLKMVS
jgi:hypothetical protein